VWDCAGAHPPSVPRPTHATPPFIITNLGQKAARPEFAELFAGNRVPPGAAPAAHCYAGHQFGAFAGQLGDGAAISLGQVRGAGGALQELQLKGAGKTPYSRAGDGRKVLRSSVRESLASEAMAHLVRGRGGLFVIAVFRGFGFVFFCFAFEREWPARPPYAHPQKNEKRACRRRARRRS
jgi:hypothetical protein